MGAVGEVEGEGGVEREGEEGIEGGGVGLEAEGLEVVEEEVGGLGGELCSDEVRVQGEAAEVGGDVGVGGVGEEGLAEVRRRRRGILGRRV